MPELPDVQVHAEYIESTALHRPVAAVDVREPGLVKNATGPDVEARLEGRSLEGTRRRGKYLFVELDDGGWLLLHFGMTGLVRTYEDASGEPEHTRLVLRFEDGGHLAYAALRKLGEIRILEDVEAFVRSKGLGPDPLKPDFGLDDFRELLDGRRGTVKGALMDQELIAGIGNEYSDEILFHAGLHPRAKVSDLDEEGVEDLYRTLRGVLETAVRARVDPEAFPSSYMLPHRHGDGECPGCGRELERMRVVGRTAYFCRRCQRRGRPG